MTTPSEFAAAPEVPVAATIYVTLRLPPQRPKNHDEQPSTGARAIRDAFSFLKGKRVLQATFIVDGMAPGDTAVLLRLAFRRPKRRRRP